METSFFPISCLLQIDIFLAKFTCWYEKLLFQEKGKEIFFEEPEGFLFKKRVRLKIKK